MYVSNMQLALKIQAGDYVQQVVPWEEGSSSEDLSESVEDADELLQGEDEVPDAGMEKFGSDDDE